MKTRRQKYLAFNSRSTKRLHNEEDKHWLQLINVEVHSPVARVNEEQHNSRNKWSTVINVHLCCKLLLGPKRPIHQLWCNQRFSWATNEMSERRTGLSGQLLSFWSSVYRFCELHLCPKGPILLLWCNDLFLSATLFLKATHSRPTISTYTLSRQWLSIFSLS